MTRRIPDLAIIGMTASVRRVIRNDIEYYIIMTKGKTNNIDLPEISIPSIFTLKDITDNNNPKQLATLFCNLLENTQNSFGDLIEMYRGDGFYADIYDAEGNRLPEND